MKAAGAKTTISGMERDTNASEWIPSEIEGVVRASDRGSLLAVLS
jgi:hypothetical protein